MRTLFGLPNIKWNINTIHSEKSVVSSYKKECICTCFNKNACTHLLFILLAFKKNFKLNAIRRQLKKIKKKIKPVLSKVMNKIKIKFVASKAIIWSNND